jgi:CheY-like chemotaxis protein
MSDHSRELERVTASLTRIQGPRRKRIVVVNDRDDSLLLLKTVLKPAYDVEAFLFGSDALADILANPPDLVITDWARPEEIDGRELIDRLRCMKPEIPILLVSGYVDFLGHPPGVTACLSLPDSPQRLSQIVRELIGGPAVSSFAKA